ncbi:MAG: hypothetical protein WA906_13520 [Pacificimonas sp.]
MQPPRDQNPRTCPLPAGHPQRWTKIRQELFITKLGATGCVSSAAAFAGMSRTSAYRFRRSPKGAMFQRAWDEALGLAEDVLTDACIERALNGSCQYLFGEEAGISQWEQASDGFMIGVLGRLSACGPRRAAPERNARV